MFLGKSDDVQFWIFKLCWERSHEDANFAEQLPSPWSSHTRPLRWREWRDYPSLLPRSTCGVSLGRDLEAGEVGGPDALFSEGFFLPCAAHSWIQPLLPTWVRVSGEYAQ